MSNLAFNVTDYSTQRPLGAPPYDDVLVLVPRRPSTLPPLVELTYSSVRLRARRLFFDTMRALHGGVVLADVPAGTYDVAIYAPYFVPVRTSISAPFLQPMDVPMHRDASFPFGPEDTLILGEVVDSTGAPHAGFDVQLQDLEPGSVQHRVPLNARGQFVIFDPEKLTTGGVQLQVMHAGGSVIVPIASVVLHRPNIVPLTTVP